MANTNIRVGSGSYQFAQPVTLNPANITANSVSTETFSVTGVNTDTVYTCDAPNLESGLFILNVYCATAGILTLQIWNATNADINPASQVFRVIGF